MLKRLKCPEGELGAREGTHCQRVWNVPGIEWAPTVHSFGEGER